MNIFQRALLAVKRRKRISCGMLAALFAAELFLMTGANILIGIDDFRTALRETGCTGFRVSEELNAATVAAIASTEGVVEYDTLYEIPFLYSDELSLLPGLFARVMGYTDYEADYGEYAEAEYLADYLGAHTPSYHAHRRTAYAPEFQSGEYELVEGRHLTEADRNAVLISDVVAERSGLALGDRYTACFDNTGYNFRYTEWADYSCALTVVGIYHTDAVEPAHEHMSESKNPANIIFLDERTAVEFFDYAGWEIEYDSAAFFVETPAALEAAMEKARTREDIAWQKYQMRHEDSPYRLVLEPFGTLKTVVWLLLAVFAGGSFGVQAQLMRCSLKERLWELRGFRRLGFSRHTVIAQHALEYALLALTAAVPAALVSAVISEPLGNLSLGTTWFPVSLSLRAVGAALAVTAVVLAVILRYQVRYSFAFSEWDR